MMLLVNHQPMMGVQLPDALPVVSLRDRFCMSRKGGTVGGCVAWVKIVWLCLDLTVKGLFGAGWVIVRFKLYWT